MYGYCRTLLLRKSCVEKISLYSVSLERADVVCISSRSSICVIELLTVFTEEL